jgi:proteasome lid subunit RPN8/RPN11
MVAQAQTELPNECCGLLAGIIENDATGAVGRVVRRFQLVNAAASPTEYQSEPRGMFVAYKEMRREALELLAIYHSHPTARAIPSRKDVERNFHGSEIVHLIISLVTDVPDVRAWRLMGVDYEEAAMELVD